jgi:hypothetical protein
MSAPPESPPPGDPRYTDDDLHVILRSGNQNHKLVGWATAQLERRRNTRNAARAPADAGSAEAGMSRAIYEAIQIKPGAFGVAIDLKLIVERFSTRIIGRATRLWAKRKTIVCWLSAGPWAVSALAAILSAVIAGVIAGVIVFGVLETQIAQLKKDLSTISPEANGPAAKLSRVSDLAEALAKVPWIDAKLKEFDDAPKIYNDTYVNDVRKNNKIPTEAALNLQAGETIKEIAKAALKRDFDIDAHPHFDANNYCCWHNDKNWPLEVDIFETANMVVDAHNTTETDNRRNQEDDTG